MKKYLYLFALLITTSLSADTVILASTFNITYSEMNPLILTQKTTIQLDEDIEVAGEIIQAGTGFDLVFSAENNEQVKITQSREWNLTSFAENTIEFTGNAQLAFDLGSTFWIEDGNIVFKDASSLLPAQITN